MQVIIMTIIFGGIVSLMVITGEGKSYPGFVIYAVAGYTLYKIAIAIINLVKVHKNAPLIIKSIRQINYADALVSIVYLQTALLSQFGHKFDGFSTLMNLISGFIVCIMISGIGIYTLIYTKKIKS